ncbi:MAG TPA: anti-sigma factor [Gemmata sp.]
MTPREQLDELLILQALHGLAPAEVAQLNALLAMFPDEDGEAIELAAAALDRALSGPPEPLPAHVAEKLELTAVAVLTSSSAPRRAGPIRKSSAWRNGVKWSGWAVAASVAVLALVLWPKKPPTVQEARAAFAQSPCVKAPFAGEKGGAAGEVVWSTEKQEGYLEVRGLPPLDPTKEQYQLWIVDPSKKQPVDGGVFDVKPDGSVLVRVRAPILVKDAKAFAVTKETAGGVVVSDGPMLLVLTPKQS